MSDYKSVLIINGSPHKDGFGAQIERSILLSTAKSKSLTIKIFHCYDREIKPCIACGKCKNSIKCCYNDLDDFYGDLQSIDYIIIISPLYFSNITGPLKTLIDRCQPFWESRENGDFIKNKKAFMIITAGRKYSNMFLPVIICLKHYFNMLNCKYNEDDFILIDSLEIEPKEKMVEAETKIQKILERDLLI